MENLTIRDVQRRVDDWIKTYGVRYFSELTNMAILTEEVGEVARIMARRVSWRVDMANNRLRPSIRSMIWPMRWPMCCGSWSVWLTRRAST